MSVCFQHVLYDVYILWFLFIISKLVYMFLICMNCKVSEWVLYLIWILYCLHDYCILNMIHIYMQYDCGTWCMMYIFLILFAYVLNGFYLFCMITTCWMCSTFSKLCLYVLYDFYMFPNSFYILFIISIVSIWLLSFYTAHIYFL